MPAPALYGICVRRVENGQPVELLACASTTDLTDLPIYMEEFAVTYADRDDVMFDLDTTLTIPPGS
ncbi:hypothetical protein [Streptomyces sp. NPDC059063]|uniref:hypothetical protein n=1 Tax=Streptomyces sp. NPDC059063 TaxID=3346712 RepID=UPI0036BD73A9